MNGNVAVVRALPDYDEMRQAHTALCLTNDPGNGRFESSFKFGGNMGNNDHFDRSFAKAANDTWLAGTKFKVVVNSTVHEPSDHSILKRQLDMGVHNLESAPGDDDNVHCSAVRLVARSVLGNEWAYKASVLHGDLSARNVVFKIREVMRNSQLLRTRDAFLSDGCGSSKCRQPATWQFMSAHSQCDPQRPILVEDEMESFFHLLLFYAIRHLPHNCRDVDTFIDQQFNGYSKGVDQDFCGLARWNAMMDGRFSHYSIAGPLTFYVPPAPRIDSANLSAIPPWSRPVNSAAQNTASSENSSSVTQDIAPKLHPINAVFSRLLRWIHAHYALTNEPKNPPTALPSHSADERDAEPSEEERWFIEEYGMDEEDEDELADEEEALGVDELTPEQRAVFMKLAPKLKEHKHAIGLFRRALSRSNQFGAWPRSDKVPDQLRSNSEW